MKNVSKLSIVKHLRLAFWYGFVLDAVSAVQMGFPGLSARLIGSAGIVISPEYRMAMWFAAALMVGWTILLAWGAMKPIERHAILPFTMVVIAGIQSSLLYAVHAGLLPLAIIIPQILLAGVGFCYYGVITHLTWRYLKTNGRKKPFIYDWQAGS